MTNYEYHQEIESLAKEAAARIKAGDDQGDVVHELVDGHQWVIYTSHNYEVMSQSPTDPWEASDEVFGTPPTSAAVAAFLCMEADLNDRLSRMDLDEDTL
jgi:hypothetical protein